MAMRYSLFLATMLLFGGCRSISISHVDHLGANKAGDRGLYYYLPRTDVLVQVEVVRTTYTPGDLRNYICLLGPYLSKEQVDGVQKNTVKKNTFALGNVVCKTLPGIDKDHLYRLELPHRLLKRDEFSLEYRGSGELKGGKRTSEDLTAKVVTQTLGSLASIAGSFGGARGTEEATLYAPVAECNDSTVDYRRAAIAWSEITELEAAQASLMETMITMEQASTTTLKLDRIKERLQILYGRFLGSTEKKTVTLSFMLRPEKWAESEDTVVLFHLDGDKGITFQHATAAPTGVPAFVANDEVFVDATIPATVPTAVTFRWVTTHELDSVFAKESAATKGSLSDCSLVYRIARTGQGVVLLGTKVKAAQDLTIPQLGGIGYLPKLRSVEFALFEGLGTLNTVSGTTRTIDPAQIDALGKVAAGLDSSLSAPDPRDKQISDLEKQVKIKELTDKLNGVVEEEEE